MTLLFCLTALAGEARTAGPDAPGRLQRESLHKRGKFGR